MKIAGVVAAAGLSSRMGAFKPLLPYEGSTILQCAVDTLLKSGAETVFVVVGHHREQLIPLLQQIPAVQWINNPDYANGDMFASVRLGLARTEPYERVFFLPGDMPAVEPQVCRTLLAELERTGAMWARPTWEGRGQHPVLLTRPAVEQVLTFSGEGGLRGALRTLPEPPLELPTESLGCQLDVDTPGQYHFLLRYAACRRADKRLSSIS